MSIDTEKLDRFTKAVDEEVDEKIEQIISEAEKSRDEILKNANDCCLELAYDRIKGEMKKISSRYVRLIASKELEFRREVLEHREKLASIIFDDVRSKLADFVSQSGYIDYLVKLIKKAENGKAVIYLSERDMALTETIKEKLNGSYEFLVDKDIRLGGLRIHFPDSNIVIDNTLDSAVLEEKELFSQGSGLRIS